MNNEYPYIRYVRKRDTVTVTWEEDKTQELYMRGAIAWPRVVTLGASPFVTAAAIVGGMDTVTKQIYILATSVFENVKSNTTATGHVTSTGGGRFLSGAFHDWACRKWFTLCPEDVLFLYTREIAADDSIQPKPIFMQLTSRGDSDLGLAIITSQVHSGMLVIDDSFNELQVSITQYKQTPEQPIALYEALVNLIFGFASYPWYDPDKDLTKFI